MFASGLRTFSPGIAQIERIGPLDNRMDNKRYFLAAGAVCVVGTAVRSSDVYPMGTLYQFAISLFSGVRFNLIICELDFQAKSRCKGAKRTVLEWVHSYGVPEEKDGQECFNLSHIGVSNRMSSQICSARQLCN